MQAVDVHRRPRAQHGHVCSTEVAPDTDIAGARGAHCVSGDLPNKDGALGGQAVLGAHPSIIADEERMARAPKPGALVDDAVDAIHRQLHRQHRDQHAILVDRCRDEGRSVVV